MITSTENTRTATSNGSFRSADNGIAGQIGNVSENLRRLRPDKDVYATEFVEQILEFADRVETSDIHLQPTANGFDVRFRYDGVLQQVGVFPIGASSSIVSRLKAISNLLSYRNDVPQEGRIELPQDSSEIRVSTYPTLYGERAVLRFFGKGNRFKQLDQLGHTDDVTHALRETLAETSGAMIVAGPAGSGKSTTLYACLRHLVDASGGARSLLTIEDPIEFRCESEALAEQRRGRSCQRPTVRIHTLFTVS